MAVAAPTFTGFRPEAIQFLADLAENNDRSWFQPRKGEYERLLKEPLEALIAALAERFAARRIPLRADPAKSPFRIYRDVRFSKDKSPYKTHIGGYIPLKRAGRKATDLPMPLYFHIGADGAKTELFAAAGHYMMEPDSLARFRAAVADPKRGKEIEKLLAGLAKKGFPSHSHGKLQRVPKGFEPDHPRAELLKLKGLTVGFPDIPKKLVTSSKLVIWLTNGCKTAAPLVEWLAFATA
jgi:uncharacterized protein (TIGR02453 family)